MGGYRADRLPELNVGDRVVAVHHLGGVVRRPVRRGTAGVVVERPSDGRLTVTFATGHTLQVNPADVALPDPRDPPPPER